MNILLIEDNKTISKGLAYSLESEGYGVTVSGSVESAYKNLRGNYSLIIIDISLPDGNGFELYDDVKRLTGAPVIFLTALDDEDSVVKGLELGADDYITKPFSTRELVARVNRLTKKGREANVIFLGDIIVDCDKSIVSKNGSAVELTALEYRIFVMLVRNIGKTVTREALLEKIWDIAGNYVNDNTLTVYIKRIRQKLDSDIIKTIKGVGYRIEKL